MERKQIPVSQVRGVSPVDGIVEAIVSVTNIVDNVNDIILPNAYKNTLKKRNPKGVWSHDTNIPVAKTLKVEELLPGDPRLPQDLLDKNAGALLVKMQFNLNTTRGRDAFEDVQFFDNEQEWSIGYSVPEGKAKTDSQGVRRIEALELYEYSPVIFGAAPHTRTLSKDGFDISEQKSEDSFENSLIENVKEIPDRYKDLDFSIPDGVKAQAKTGLEWANEYNRGGTSVGKATARYLMNNSTADWRKVFHISAYFARHENEMSLPANSEPGADGYPGNGLIAWKLWGGTAGRTWSQKLVKAMQSRDEDSGMRVVRGPGGRVAGVRQKKAAEISDAVSSRLHDLVSQHNEKYGDSKGKKVTYQMLASVFKRGVGAYHTNPTSVRPTVSSPEQWAYARVNAFLYAVRTGKYRGGQFDTDLLPEGHPLSTSQKDAYTEMPGGTPSQFGTPQRIETPTPPPSSAPGMPKVPSNPHFSVAQDVEGCNGFAVVHSDTKKMVVDACFMTREEAQSYATELNSANGDKKEDPMGHSEVNLSPRQEAMHEMYDSIVEEYGMFSQDSLADGAHYAPADLNPFKEQGLVCKNCVFYEGGQRCHLVEGTIEPEAICKLWIIPADLIKEPQKSDDFSEEKSLDFDEKGMAIRSHSTPVRDDMKWVDYVQYKRMKSPADPSYYAKIFGARLPGNDGTRKTHYTFVHHFVDENGTPGAASWAAVNNSMSVLNGARSGTRLRGADRVAVYNHFKRHYQDYGKEVPELKSDSELDQIMMTKGIIDAPLTKEDINE